MTVLEIVSRQTCPARTGGYARLIPLLLALVLPVLAGCGRSVGTPGKPPAAGTAPALTQPQSDPLAGYTLTGDTHPVLDPSVIRQGRTWYAFSTDVRAVSAGGHLAIRCSEDEVAWRPCGRVYTELPAWVRAAVPDARGLWAPDVSFFGGLYHVYYAASTVGSLRSGIGLATSPTLDPTDPAYGWTDRGAVIESRPGADADAIDPNVLVDADGAVYLNYGSYWTGIKQLQLDPASGMLLPGARRYDLAARPAVPDHAIEGSSMVRHGGYYYLFVSIDHCCNRDFRTDDYKEAVGRGTSPRGPFKDRAGRPMLRGGGTVLLAGDPGWLGPGGGTAYVDSETGESVLVFHAHRLDENGRPYLWLKHLDWVDGWPVIQYKDEMRGS